MTKHVLVHEKRLMLPILKVRPSKDVWKSGTCISQEETIINRMVMSFDLVQDEVWMDGRRPDIVMWKGDRKLLVEVFVTHDIDKEKLLWIRQHDVPTIKVDMSWADYRITLSTIRKSLRLGKAAIATPRFNIVGWVHHPRTASAQERVNEAYLRSIAAVGVIPEHRVARQETKQRERQKTIQF